MLDPLTVDLTADLLASKAALAVGQVEAELLALLLHRHGKTRNVGHQGVTALEDRQAPAHIGTEARVRDPKTFQVSRASSLRGRGG